MYTAWGSVLSYVVTLDVTGAGFVDLLDTSSVLYLHQASAIAPDEIISLLSIYTYNMPPRRIAYMHLITAACSFITKRVQAFSPIGNSFRTSEFSSLRFVSDFPQGSLSRSCGITQRIPLCENIYNPQYRQHLSKILITTKRFNSRGTGKDKEESFFTKALDKIKSIVPFLKDDKQKKDELVRKESARRVSSEIDRMFKDAPLGLRMMSKMISPLFGSLAGGLVEAAREQTRQMDELLNECENLIVSDYAVRQVLGEVIELGSPFSQSSSTVSVNGETRKQVEARFQVTGNRGAGIGTLYATERGIENLVVNINGRNLYINTSGPVSVTSDNTKVNIMKNKKFGKDDIIDAELVEKVKK